MSNTHCLLNGMLRQFCYSTQIRSLGMKTKYRTYWWSNFDCNDPMSNQDDKCICHPWNNHHEDKSLYYRCHYCLWLIELNQMNSHPIVWQRIVLLVSHDRPVKPIGHWQRYVRRYTTHVPLFRQGWCSHARTSRERILLLVLLFTLTTQTILTKITMFTNLLSCISIAIISLFIRLTKCFTFISIIIHRTIELEQFQIDRFPSHR